MKLDDFVAVSGMSGVFKMVANRKNGLIIEDLDTGKRKLAPARKHQFTPLSSIAIYVIGVEDTIELTKVFHRMQEQLEDNPPVSVKAPTEEIKSYFTDIVPNYDEDRVYPSDMKKIIKWFTYLNDRGQLVESDDASADEEE